MPLAAAQLAAAALGIAFLIAALAKIAAPSSWWRTLSLHELPTAGRAVIAIAVPAAELTVAWLAAAGRGTAAATLALLLLGLFSLSLLRARARGTRKLPCGCFGRASTLDARTVLLRNALLAMLAGTTLLAPGEVRPLEALPPLPNEELIPGLLTLGGVALALWAVWAAGISLRGSSRR